jgi:hypothetical protein
VYDDQIKFEKNKMIWVEKIKVRNKVREDYLSDSATTQNTSPTTQNHLTKNLNHSFTSKTNPNLAESRGKSRRVNKISE